MTQDLKAYKIVRMYQDPDRRSRVIRSRVTLAEAQAHCQDPETSSRTCTRYAAQQRTARYGPWFDGYEER
jgi:hypothetical protein